MKNLILGMSLLLAAQIVRADELTVIASSRALELTAHRVEKLVGLKKIDSSFSAKLDSIVLEKLSPTQAGEPAFLATVSQYAGTDGTQNQVEIILDDQGKALSFKVKSGAAAQNAPVWPSKDALSLVENSLHHLLDHGAHDAELKPFYDSATSLKLVKVSKDGQEVATAEIHAKDTERVLSVILKLDGTFVAHEIN